MVDVDGEVATEGNGGRTALLLSGVLGIGLAVGVQQLLRDKQARDGEAGDKPRTPAARLHDFNSKMSKSRGAGAGADVPQEAEDGIKGGDGALTPPRGLGGDGEPSVSTSPFSTPVREALGKASHGIPLSSSTQSGLSLIAPNQHPPWLERCFKLS